MNRLNRVAVRGVAGALLLANFIPLVAHADTLFTVPVAGLLEPRRLTTNLSLGSGADLNEQSTSVTSTVDYNVTHYFSAGWTTRWTNGITARPQGSLQFAPEGKPYAFALGFANVGVRTFRSQPYATANTSLGNFGLYGGATHDSYGTHPMAGLDYVVSSRWSLQGDWINDDANFYTLGARWQIRKKWALSAGFSHSSLEGSSNGVFASVFREFHL